MPVAIAVERVEQATAAASRCCAAPCRFASSCVGSWPSWRATVVLELLLVVDQLPPRVLELRFEELVRALGKDLAVAKALVDEQRRQALGDPHRRARIVAR